MKRRGEDKWGRKKKSVKFRGGSTDSVEQFEEQGHCSGVGASGPIMATVLGLSANPGRGVALQGSGASLVFSVRVCSSVLHPFH